MQQEFQPSAASFGDSEPSIRRGAFARAAQALAARFARGAAERLEEPFRDSDFEEDSGYFGRPLCDH
jgi:hypothetical protein